MLSNLAVSLTRILYSSFSPYAYYLQSPYLNCFISARFFFSHRAPHFTYGFSVLVRYLIQDIQFLDAFVILVASVVANARSLEDRIPGCQFLAFLTGTENTYFDRSLRKLLGDSHESVLKDMPTHDCTHSFIQLMLDVARHGALGCV